MDEKHRVISIVGMGEGVVVKCDSQEGMISSAVRMLSRVSVEEWVIDKSIFTTH